MKYITTYANVTNGRKSNMEFMKRNHNHLGTPSLAEFTVNGCVFQAGKTLAGS